MQLNIDRAVYETQKNTRYYKQMRCTSREILEELDGPATSKLFALHQNSNFKCV